MYSIAFDVFKKFAPIIAIGLLLIGLYIKGRIDQETLDTEHRNAAMVETIKYVSDKNARIKDYAKKLESEQNRIQETSNANRQIIEHYSSINSDRLRDFIQSNSKGNVGCGAKTSNPNKSIDGTGTSGTGVPFEVLGQLANKAAADAGLYIESLRACRIELVATMDTLNQCK